MSGQDAPLIDPAAILYLERLGYVVVPRHCVSPDGLAQALTIGPEERARLAREPWRYAGRLVAPGTVLAAVAEATGATSAQLTGISKTAGLSRRRQLGMHYAHRELGYSMPQTGRLFGGRDHTTVLHAVRRVTALLEDDATRDETRATLAAIGEAHRARVLAVVERAVAAKSA